jgi:hypothetical protein
MNPALIFSTALAALLAVSTEPSLQSPVTETLGGGTLQVGQETFKFAFDSLNLAPAQPKLKTPRTFVLRGKLTPIAGTALSFELTALEDGRIYGLRIVRKHPNATDDDRWSVTLKTKVEVLELNAQPGGKLRIALSGPLTSVESGKAGAASWKGELWATFREVPL